MAKTRTQFVCQQCGRTSAREMGRCPQCGAWNSFIEEIIAPPAPEPKFRSGLYGTASTPKRLTEIDTLQQDRLLLPISEFARVLGGGIVPGSIILIGGDPGIGKSTLLLQVALEMAKQESVLYVSGEESERQIRMRAQRLLSLDPSPDQNKETAKTFPQSLFLVTETNLPQILEHVAALKPRLLIIDSIQTMQLETISSAAGSVVQVRETAAVLTRYAKQTGTAVFLVGHVTKSGEVAGPRVLEHIVDAVIFIEGQDSRYRLMRALKNRFGAVNEIGFFAMTDKGMKEVKNPSAIFLNRDKQGATPGAVVLGLWEGTRPLLVELQALVDHNAFGAPRRVAVGLDGNRLTLLLAVLNRHGGVQAGDQDVYVNVVGGVKVTETSADLPLLLAIVSSLRNKAVSPDLLAFGEVGLSGEIRPVQNGQERLQEAVKHGFSKAIVPQGNVPKTPINGLEVVGVASVEAALAALLTLSS